MEPTVLIVTNSRDESALAVLAELDRLGTPYLRFDAETFPEEKVIAMSLSSSGLIGTLQDAFGSELLRLDNVRSVWYRRPLRSWISSHLPAGHAQFVQEESRAALWSLYTALGAFWMNPPLQGVHLLQHNKLHQMQAATRLGLRVPDSIITNDPDALLGFTNAHGGTIAVKIIKGNSFVREDSPAIPLHVFTNVLHATEIAEHRDDIRLCPVFAQEYVPKRLEFRITIVAGRVFACAIHSQDSEETRHDWRRYDFARVKHELYHLPAEIEDKLKLLLAQLKLNFGAIDMIVTPEDEHVFLEVNPSGQWGWIERLTGMQISRAIAETLANPPNIR